MLAPQTPGPSAAITRRIEVDDARDFFEAKASRTDRDIFPNGIDDLCDRAYGAFLGGRLIGVATTRDAMTYWNAFGSRIEAARREQVLAALLRVGIYDPVAISRVEVPQLRQVMQQLAWVAVGGQRGWEGRPHGTELFGRFIEEGSRGRGHGLTLLDRVITDLDAEGKLPLRALPASKQDRSYAGRADGRRFIVMNRDFFSAALSGRKS